MTRAALAAAASTAASPPHQPPSDRLIALPSSRTLFTGRAILLFFTGLLIAGSAYQATRFAVGGLLVHPYLPLATMLFVFVGLPRLGRMPRPLLVSMGLFLALYLLSLFPGGKWLGEFSKVAAIFITTIGVALAIRREEDLIAATLGFAAAVTIISISSLIGGSGVGSEGLNPLEEVANKNAYSLYALPALLLCGHFVLDRAGARWFRVALGVAALFIVLAIFSSGNRSGWLGVVAIGVMLLSTRRRPFTVLVVGILAFGTYLIVTNYLNPEVVERRVAETQTSNISDNVRRQLFESAVAIGLENPILGLSPQQLPFELARRVRVQQEVIDPHNAFGLIIGGSGFTTLGALLTLGYFLWKRPARLNKRLPSLVRARAAHNLLRMMVVLWVLRSLFTREIFYNPGFGMGLGIALGGVLAYLAIQRPSSRLASSAPLGELPPR